MNKKGFLLATSAGFAFAPAAHAADMPLRAPPAPLPPAPIWTGLYIGGHVGSVWQQAQNTVSGNFTSGYFGSQVNATPTTTASGFIGGGQIGYNWQHGSYVFGVEADFSFSGIKGGRNTGFLTPPPTLLSRSFVESDKLPWLATVRGRIGLTWQNFLLYATGGLAAGEHKFSQSIFTITAVRENFGSVSTTKFGWTAGAGIEASIAGNWTAKAEYLYIDLGSATVFSDTNTDQGIGLTITTSSKLTASIARLGLNYRFGGI